MNRWEPKPPLDLRSGSLLRSIGLTERAGKMAQLVWLLAVLAATSVHFADWKLSLGGWALGSFAVNYIAARLGGRPATYTFVGDQLYEDDSAFQERLLIDVTMILYFLSGFSLAILGPSFFNWIAGFI
jgi:hypothetical protein